MRPFCPGDVTTTSSFGHDAVRRAASRTGDGTTHRTPPDWLTTVATSWSRTGRVPPEQPTAGYAPSMEGTMMAFAVLAWLSYVVSRLLARRRVPELVGFILVGLALGPSGAGVIDEQALRDLQPVTEVALGMLMFIIGEQVSPRLMQRSKWPLIVAAVQYVVVGGAVFATLRWVGAPPPLALLLAVVAGAGAPMTVASIVSAHGSRGVYERGLVATHAIADALATLAFAAVLPVARMLSVDGGGGVDAMLRFIRLGLGGIVLGIALGWWVARHGRAIETSGELLLFLAVHLLGAWAVASAAGISLPLVGLAAGATSETLLPREFSHRQFRVARSVEQPLYLVFFALAGAGMHLEALPEVGVVGVTYLVVRSAAKIAGGAAGALLARQPITLAARLGFDLLPQAGVAVALAVLARETLPDIGADVATVLLGSVVLFELVGPIIVARGLRRARVEPETTERPNDVPEVVAIVAEHDVAAPAWVLDLCAQWRSKVILIAPCEAVVDLGTRPDVDLEHRPWDRVSGRVALARVIMAATPDLVVVLAPARRRWHDTLLRRVTAPAVVVPSISVAAERL